MKVTGLSPQEIYQAAKETGHIAIHNFRPANVENSYRFVLRPTDEHYHVIYPKSGRRVDRVNWYGYRDFIRNLFQIKAEIVVKTAWDRYYCREDFENRYHETAYRKLSCGLTPLELTGRDG